MPPLSKNNCFTALSVEEIPESNTTPLTDKNKIKAISNTQKHPPPCVRCPKWERHLPQCYTIVVNIPLKSLELVISLKTTDTGTIIPMKALLDCRATGLFIGTKFVRQKGLTTKKLSQSIPVYNVDGTLNKAGSISEVWEATLQHCDHSE
jgi:hypothetical protein